MNPIPGPIGIRVAESLTDPTVESHRISIESDCWFGGRGPEMPDWVNGHGFSWVGSGLGG